MTQVTEGSRVAHVKVPDVAGTVREIDSEDSVLVEWDDRPGVLDFQWVTKLYALTG